MRAAEVSTRSYWLEIHSPAHSREPLWAAAAGIAIGGEHLGALGLVGAALVLAGTTWGRRAADGTACQVPPPCDH